jgi:hypothetical protein
MSNIIPLVKEREVAFMIPFSLRKETGNYPVRCIKAHFSGYLNRNFEAFSFFTREYNLYHSIYLLRDMPMMSFSPLKRSEQQHEFFKKYDDFVEGIDFVMDFDGDKTLPLSERIEQAREATMGICAILDKYSVPYCVMFSGSKGFHIEVRGFPPTRERNKRIKQFSDVAIRLVLLSMGADPNIAGDESQENHVQKLLSLCSFDSSIYTVTRIWKVPYSYDVSTDMICFPLTPIELKTFILEDYKAENIMKRNLWGRGLVTRKGTIDNFWHMAQELGVTQ